MSSSGLNASMVDEPGNARELVTVEIAIPRARYEHFTYFVYEWLTRYPKPRVGVLLHSQGIICEVACLVEP